MKAVRLLFKKIVDSKKDVKAELLRIYIVCIVDCPMGSVNGSCMFGSTALLSRVRFVLARHRSLGFLPNLM